MCESYIEQEKHQVRERAGFYHINRRENIHELIRNLVYFKDKNKAAINLKVVLQYYINRKKCGDKEEVQYTAPNHDNSGAERLFFAIFAFCKSTLQSFKKQVSNKY